MKAVALTLFGLLVVACGVIRWQQKQGLEQDTALVAAQAAAFAADFEASAARSDVQQVITYVDRVRVIHRVRSAIQQEIPRHVTPEIDRAFPLPLAFVRVHDAAATGVPLDDSTGDLDGAPAGIAPSEAALLIAENYGNCHSDAERLRSLQMYLVAHGLAEPRP